MGSGVQVQLCLHRNLARPRLHHVDKVAGIGAEMRAVADAYHARHAFGARHLEKLAHIEALRLDVLLLGAGRQRIVHAVDAPQVRVGIDIAEVVGECGLARRGNGKGGGGLYDLPPAENVRCSHHVLLSYERGT